MIPRILMCGNAARRGRGPGTGLIPILFQTSDKRSMHMLPCEVNLVRYGQRDLTSLWSLALDGRVACHFLEGALV